MITEQVKFFSDGLQLDGTFFLPDSGQDASQRPIIVICSGFTGVASFHPARFARFLTARNWTCFSFDYRGFADSEGTRNRVILEEQVRDIESALAFVAGDQRATEDGLFLLGWGMAAGLVISAACSAPPLRGLGVLNGFYDGRRFQLARRGAEGFAAFERDTLQEKKKRARTGASEWRPAFDIYPLDWTSEGYVDHVLRKHPGFNDNLYSFELAESLLGWCPEAVAEQLTIPLFLAHGSANKLHPPEEATALLERYGGETSVEWLESAGHTEWMLDDNPTFQRLSKSLEAWLRYQILDPEPEFPPA